MHDDGLRQAWGRDVIDVSTSADRHHNNDSTANVLEQQTIVRQHLDGRIIGVVIYHKQQLYRGKLWGSRKAKMKYMWIPIQDACVMQGQFVLLSWWCAGNFHTAFAKMTLKIESVGKLFCKGS